MRFSWAVFVKEMREARWKWIIGGAFLFLTGASLPLLFPYLQQMMQGITLPGPWASALDAQLRNYPAYLWLNWYGKNLFQFLLVMAALLGGSSISAERSRGSWEFLLAQPVSKTAVFISKYAAGLVLLFAVAAVPTVFLAPLSRLIGEYIQLTWFIRGLPVTLASASLFYSLCWILGVILDDSLKAAAAGAACCVAVLAIGWFPALQRIALSRHLAAVGTMQTGAVDWPAVAAITLLSAAAAGAAYQLYRGRDY